MARMEFPPERSNRSAKSQPLLETAKCSLPAVPSHNRRLSPREIEVRYFVPDITVETLARNQRYLVIEQHYFPQKAVKDLVAQFGISRVVTDYQEFSSARVRRTKYPDETYIYELEFKGPKTMAAGSLISRSELSIAISRDLFEDLRPEASAGALKKRRYNITGKIEGATSWENAIGHLDILRRAGKDLDKVRPCISTIDIELGKASLIQSLRAGRHSFGFLSSCVEITRLGNSVRSAISNSSIAEQGLGDDQKKALNELRQEAGRLLQLQRKLKGE